MVISDEKYWFKPTALGLEVFGNKVENVAKAFYIAAKEHEQELKKKTFKYAFKSFTAKDQLKR